MKAHHCTGETAYLVSIYFSQQKDICSRKSSLELICSDGLGGNDRDVANVVSKSGQKVIFLEEKEAKVIKLLLKNLAVGLFYERTILPLAQIAMRTNCQRDYLVKSQIAKRSTCQKDLLVTRQFTKRH